MIIEIDILLWSEAYSVLLKSELEEHDISGMHKIYDKWSSIARESFESRDDSAEFGNVNHIIFAGMGGSGTIGDVFAAILSKTKIHVNVVKGYLLPNTVNSETLVVVTSVSGNTAEALASLEAAHKTRCKIIAFSSGGKMQKYCTRNNIEHRIITQYHSPRASFTSYLYSMLRVLYSTLAIDREYIVDSLSELDDLKESVGSLNLTDTNPSLALASWITGNPMIYYPFGLQSAAVRFKNSLQENAKKHAFTEDVIEASHNGVMAWERQSNVQPVIIRGQDDYFRTKERWEIIKEYFVQNQIEYREIVSVKKNILSKLVNLIYILDYTTIYLAALNRVDPSPVNSIDFIKDKEVERRVAK